MLRQARLLVDPVDDLSPEFRETLARHARQDALSLGGVDQLMVDEAVYELRCVIQKLLEGSRPEKYVLDTARVLEGVIHCLEHPADRVRLARAAACLIGIESKLPRSPRESTRAEQALKKAVQVAINERAKEGHGGQSEEDFIARRLCKARADNRHLGAESLLPFYGPREWLEVLLADAIKKLRDVTEQDKELDPYRVIAVCARACGSKKREFFASERKRMKRK
jgi:hypothetical protein